MRERKCGRGVAIALATVLAAAILMGIARAAPAGFLHLRNNLSRTTGRMSAYPSLAVGSDGNWVAVVWVEEYRANAGYYGHVYLRAASEAGGGWGATLPVFTASDSACAYYRASVAVAGTTAHLAYIVFDDCAQSSRHYTRVYYQTCPLTGGPCASSQEVASTEYPYQITWVDLALDASNNPHVVWVEYYRPSETSKIFYRTRDGSGWGSKEEVYAPAAEKNNTPAIAWGGNYAHVVWENEWGSAQPNNILYRRRPVTGTWESALTLFHLAPEYELRNPNVAAGAGRVFVVWDVYHDPGFGWYTTLYRRSNSNGAGFLTTSPYNAREVGTDSSNLADWAMYELTDEEYLPYLQPAIALDGNGWPAVVWHAAYPEGPYAVYYSYAITGTDTTVSWVAPAVLRKGRAGAAAVGVFSVGEPGGEWHLHAAYMEKLSTGNWDVFYDSNEWDRYKHVYLPLVLRNFSPPRYVYLPFVVRNASE